MVLHSLVASLKTKTGSRYGEGGEHIAGVREQRLMASTLSGCPAFSHVFRSSVKESFNDYDMAFVSVWRADALEPFSFRPVS